MAPPGTAEAILCVFRRQKGGLAIATTLQVLPSPLSAHCPQDEDMVKPKRMLDNYVQELRQID